MVESETEDGPNAVSATVLRTLNARVVSFVKIAVQHSIIIKESEGYLKARTQVWHSKRDDEVCLLVRLALLFSYVLDSYSTCATWIECHGCLFLS